MKKRALRKDFYMEIRKSLGRFLSIFFIVALGVSFFSGIRASEPDMRISGDAYFDEKNLMDIKVYVDTDDDIRIIRRIQRDMEERGRSLDSIIGQYLATVKPMYHQFIEPTKRYADLIVPEGGENQVAIDLLSTKVRDILVKRGHTELK